MALRAPVNTEIYGSIEEGAEVYHEIYLYQGESFDILLEADDDEVDIDLYIADKAGNVLYKDEDRSSEATVCIQPGKTAIYTLVVKAADGNTDYTLKIQERN